MKGDTNHANNTQGDDMYMVPTKKPVQKVTNAVNNAVGNLVNKIKIDKGYRE